MEDAQIKQMIAKLSEQLINAAGQLSALKASVSVLKGALATLLNPENPLEVLEFFRNQETKFLKMDPQAQAQQEASEIIAAVKLWKSGGTHES